MYTITTTAATTATHEPCAYYADDYPKRAIDAVCEAFRITKEDIQSKCRSENIKLSRWMVWQILYVYEGSATTKSLGAMFGRDHTTVVHCLDTFPEDLKRDKTLRALFVEICQRAGVDFDEIKRAQAQRLRKKKKLPSKMADRKGAIYRKTGFTPITPKSPL